MALKHESRRKRGAAALLSRPLSDGLSLGDHLLAGGVATGAAVCSVHPLDTLKTVMQTEGAAGGGALQALQKLTRSGGMRALYAGVGGSLGGQVPAGAIKLAVFEALSQAMRPHRIPQPVAELACAAAAFFACSVVLVPGEVIKQRVQAGLHRSAGEAVRSALRDRGVRGLYAGYGATVVRDVPYTMLEFGSYAAFKRVCRAALRRQKLRPQEEWAMGGLAGGFTGLITTPLDVAKTRLMTQTATGVRYAGVADVLRRTARDEGVRGLFRGSTARIAWLVPFTAVFFGVHEASKRMILQRKSIPPTTSADARLKST